MRGLKMIRKCH